MAYKRKRAPGAGRPPKGEFSGLKAQMSLRMPVELREQIEAAAKLSGKNPSQELMRRLRDTFYRDGERSRDPAQYALCFLLGELIELVARTTSDVRKPSAWRSDPFAFRVIKLAFDKILGALEPSGEIRPLSGERSYAGLVIAANDESPEAMANTAASAIITWLVRPQMSDDVVVDGERIFSSEQEKQHYRMTNAWDDLRLNKGKRS
jgi:hypothetical protein